MTAIDENVEENRAPDPLTSPVVKMNCATSMARQRSPRTPVRRPVEEKRIESRIRFEKSNDRDLHELDDLAAAHESLGQSALKAQLDEEMRRHDQLQRTCADQEAQIGELDKEISRQRSERQKAVEESQKLDADLAALVVQEAFLLLEIDSQHELNQDDAPRPPTKKGKAKRKKATPSQRRWRAD
jgi:septal ring factor EnvC (AmiA/AmiB activator)